VRKKRAAARFRCGMSNANVPSRERERGRKRERGSRLLSEEIETEAFEPRVLDSKFSTSTSPPLQLERWLSSSPSLSPSSSSSPPTPRHHSWTAAGTLFLSNMRLVFVAAQPDAVSGLVAFSLPLALLSDDTSFVQPIFRCNHLAGSVKAEGGDGSGNEAQHKFKLEFREGGVGTFLPLFLRFLEYLRAVRRKAETGSAAWTPPVAPTPTPAAASTSTAPSRPPAPVQPMWPAAAPPIEPGAAFVDPSDPSKIYLTAPISESAGAAPFGGAGWGGAPAAPAKK